MSWSDNNNNDPWGSSGNGSGRRGPGPNMDDVIRNAQNRFKGNDARFFFWKVRTNGHHWYINTYMACKWFL